MQDPLDRSCLLRRIIFTDCLLLWKEFFKILFNGLNVDINPNVAEAPYADVSVDDWFAPYISYAKSIGLIDSEVENINPSQGMSRGDTADAMYRLVKLLE